MPVFIFPYYKSMAAISCRCHSNQSSYPIWTKKQYDSFPLPIDAICDIWQNSVSWFQKRCRLKMLTTTTDDDGRTDDGCLPIL